MSRAERRREQKELKKLNRGIMVTNRIPAPLNVVGYNMEQLAGATGLKVKSLEVWAAQQTKEITDSCILEFNEKLYEAENYVALINVLISMRAIEMTWGYKKSVERFLQNFSEAKDYVKANGLKKVLEESNRKYNANLEFDSFDIEDFIKNCEEDEMRIRVEKGDDYR